MRDKSTPRRGRKRPGQKISIRPTIAEASRPFELPPATDPKWTTRGRHRFNRTADIGHILLSVREAEALYLVVDKITAHDSSLRMIRMAGKPTSVAGGVILPVGWSWGRIVAGARGPLRRRLVAWARRCGVTLPLDREWTLLPRQDYNRLVRESAIAVSRGLV